MLKLLPITMCLLLLAGCNGSSSDNDSAVDLSQDGVTEELLPDGVEESDVSAETTTGTNLAVVDFSIEGEYEGLDSSFEMSATIVNNGNRTATIPRSWVMLSTSSDFSNGFRYEVVDLTRPGTATERRSLERGEEDVFTARFMAGIATQDPIFFQLLLNPDTGVLFITPEPRIMVARELEETSYDDNLSSRLTLENNSPATALSCEDEPLEENDTIETAPLILLGETYDMLGCLDIIDIFAIDLEANESYEVSVTGITTFVNLVELTVIRPDSTYLLQDGGGDKTVTTDQSGVHYIAVRYTSGLVRDGSISINQVSL